VSIETTTPTPRRGRKAGDGAKKPAAEGRSWKPTTDVEARSNPSLTVRLPGGKSKTVVVDRVRAKPAMSSTLSGTLGQNALGLGIWGTMFPRSVNRFLGMNADPTAIRVLFGARELYTAFSLIGDPTRKDALWARVVGDLFDIALLSSLTRRSNPKRGNAKLALGVVLAVTALDALAAYRMTTIKRNCD
jgi:hypothetical protein